jgi:hypothetical protein
VRAGARALVADAAKAKVHAISMFSKRPKMRPENDGSAKPDRVAECFVPFRFVSRFETRDRFGDRSVRLKPHQKFMLTCHLHESAICEWTTLTSSCLSASPAAFSV